MNPTLEIEHKEGYPGILILNKEKFSNVLESFDKVSTSPSDILE